MNQLIDNQIILYQKSLYVVQLCGPTYTFQSLSDKNDSFSITKDNVAKYIDQEEANRVSNIIKRNDDEIKILAEEYSVPVEELRNRVQIYLQTEELYG